MNKRLKKLKKIKKIKSKKIALFIGRFQPFHNGHLYALKKILQKFDKVIILIGSSQYLRTKKNPLSYKERLMLIKNVLKRLKTKKWRIKKIKIADLKDKKSDLEWIKILAKKYNPNKYVICTKNKLVKKLAKSFRYEIYEPEFKNRNFLSGRLIRQKILQNKSIKKLVPKEVFEWLEKNKKKIFKKILQ